MTSLSSFIDTCQIDPISSRCFLIVNEPFTQQEAQSWCQLSGGQLAQVDSDYLTNFLINNFTIDTSRLDLYTVQK